MTCMSMGESERLFEIHNKLPKRFNPLKFWKLYQLTCIYIICSEIYMVPHYAQVTSQRLLHTYVTRLQDKGGSNDEKDKSTPKTNNL